MLASFVDELKKIAEGNVAEPAKPTVGGFGGNIAAKPMPSPGIGKSMSSTKPGPAKTTNYTMVHSTAPMAALGAGEGAKAMPPPPVRT